MTVMKITRRTFLKVSGATAVGTVIGGLGFDLSPAEVYAQELRIKGAKETTSICCYCSVGCGIIVHTDDKGKVINAEGDPDHPISEGALCAKGASSYQIAVNPNRLQKVLYRAPYSAAWKEVKWEWALEKIAANIKKSRDSSFMEKNAQVILNMGGNVAENHPVSFKWIQAAKDKGAIFIHVDPRFTRTSTKADIFVRLRSGTDIAFLGGMIKYLLDNNLYDEFYVKNYTNASLIVNPKYGFDDGLFSGYDSVKRTYDKSTWALEKDEQGIPKRDMTLQDPRCVFQLLKKHYSRYTLQKVSES